MGQSKKIGLAYEQVAVEYLERKGCRVLNRNFYTKFGEVDIIVSDGEYLVFVEVKYRTDRKGGHPLEVVDVKKQMRIKKAAQFYLLRYGFSENTPCRFDVIGILKDEIFHIENAFE